MFVYDYYYVNNRSFLVNSTSSKRYWVVLDSEFRVISPPFDNRYDAAEYKEEFYKWVLMNIQSF